jgi:hypothetical protein
MLSSVQLRRLIAATLVCASVVLGISFLMGSGRAASKPTAADTCSAADKQFLSTVSSNMTQLQYWSDSLQSGDATASVVVKQAHSEALQIWAAQPTDPYLVTSRSLLRKMFDEYGLAVKAKALGTSPGVHVRTVYSLANDVHELLVQAQPGMTAKGCNLTPLLSA